MPSGGKRTPGHRQNFGRQYKTTHCERCARWESAPCYNHYHGLPQHNHIIGNVSFDPFHPSLSNHSLIIKFGKNELLAHSIRLANSFPTLISLSNLEKIEF
jgi:hypothetical protein